MIRRPPRSTRTDTLFPYTTLFRSHVRVVDGVHARPGDADLRTPVAVEVGDGRRTSGAAAGLVDAGGERDRTPHGGEVVVDDGHEPPRDADDLNFGVVVEVGHPDADVAEALRPMPAPKIGRERGGG